MMKKLVWVMTILWMCLIFYFSHQPADVSVQESGDILVKLNLIEENEVLNREWSILRLQIIVRKWAHFIEYFVLGLLMTLSILSLNLNLNLNFNLILNLNLKLNLNYILSWLLCTIYGALDELHQCFVPGRGPGIYDIVLDSLSSLLAVILVFLVVILFKIQKSKITEILRSIVNNKLKFKLKSK